MAFLEAIGTGFIVDQRGVVLTAAHVARDLQALPKNPLTGRHGAAAILFGTPVRVGNALESRSLWVEIRGYSLLEHFTIEDGDFYGESIPDLALIQLAVCDVPALSFNSAPELIQVDYPSRSPAFHSVLKASFFGYQTRNRLLCR